MKRRGFEPPDHGLWDDVRRTIKPLRVLAKPKQAETVQTPSARIPIITHVLPIQQVQKLVTAARKSNAPPPLAAFDRRTAQKLSRGQSEPDGRIDLHGETVETARVRLYHYLENQRLQGSRMVLVITGKGASPFARHTLHGMTHFHTPEREGRLRREVPMWLNEHHFRIHVVGFQPAHPRHGGGGAFYVRLRRSSQDMHP
jgi:DNA-nicking Smr family endonuclease